jgi:hypothetical protein
VVRAGHDESSAECAYGVSNALVVGHDISILKVLRHAFIHVLNDGFAIEHG